MSEWLKNLVSDYPDRPLLRCLLDPSDLRESGYMDYLYTLGTNTVSIPEFESLWKSRHYRAGWKLGQERRMSRLSYLREQVDNERISYAELVELQELDCEGSIPEDDTVLLEWAGVPEDTPPARDKTLPRAEGPPST